MLTVKTNTPAFARGLKREFERNSRDFEVALKVTGYRLRDKMKQEVKEGRAGHSRFKPLTFIARGLGIKSGRRFRKDRPLIRLSNAIFYEIDRKPNLEMRIGFTGRSLPIFRKIARAQQEGFTKRIGTRLRKEIISEGARRLKGHRDAGYADRTPFFLKKSTKSFKTPARPIVGPFWVANREQAWVDIRRRFRRKRAGERI